MFEVVRFACLGQGPEATPAVAIPPASGGGFWAWLRDVAAVPGNVELALGIVLVVGLGLLWWRLARLVSGARSRQALADYLLGVEQALHGDLDGAHERLNAVLAQDPENHYARLLLGKVLAERGDPSAAHTQHLFLQRAFAIVSPENELLLAQSLLAAGNAREAAEAAERALLRAPERRDGWQFVYRARLQAGDFAAAATAGKRLVEMVGNGAGSSAVRADVARTLAQAGLERLRAGDAAVARANLLQAQRLRGAGSTDDADGGGADGADGADGHDSVRLLSARLRAHEEGYERVVPALLDGAAAAAAAAHLPMALADTAMARALATTGPGQRLPSMMAPLPMSPTAGLAGMHRWACRACSGPLDGAVVECPRCHARGSAELREPQLVLAVASPTQTMDAVDENQAHVQRLVRQVLDGPTPAGGRDELLELGERAVEELLRQAWQRSDAGREVAIDVLRTMGPAITPALFAASDALEKQRFLPVGSRSPAALVGRIVQGFDRDALPHVGALFASARPEHRKILIDFFLGLADLDEFQLVLERFPPLEILHRLNKSDDEVLRRFLRAVPAGHFVAESLLLEPTFYREDQVLAAIPGAAHPEVLVQVLLRRGATRTLTKALITAVGDDELCTSAERLLVDLGEPVLDHVLSAYAEPERSPDERRRLARILTNAGALAVEPLCASFGPEPSAFDDDVSTVLGAMGDAAVVPLQAAYGQSGWLERMSAGLISRQTNRRVQIVRTLRLLGTPAARAALQALADLERDHNLRLRLRQALHALDEADTGSVGGSDGEAPAQDDGGAHGQTG